MPDLMTIGGGAISTLKGVIETIKRLQKLSQDAAVNQTAIELQGAILSLQSEILDMQTKYGELLQIKNDLEKNLADADQWAETAKKYELKTVAPGTTVYLLKEEYRDSEPIHGICTNCYENGHKSIISYKGERQVNNNIMNIFMCTNPSCKTEWAVLYGTMGADFPLLG